MTELPETADVVVIGGGIMGTSALYHLARLGCANAVLIERETIGAGATSKAAGGFRAQFSDELNIRIALESIRRLARFDQEFGVDIDFKQWGYLFLLREEEVLRFQRSIELQNRLGVPSEMFSSAEALEIVPQLNVDDVAAATFCSLDGYCTPEAVVQGYARAAVELGARVVQGCEVLSVAVQQERIRGVQTARGEVAAPLVVCTAGVWSRDLAAHVGVDLPVEPEKRHVFLTEGLDPLPHELPLTIDFASGFYFQREGEAILFGGREGTLEELAPHATHRLPLLEEMPVRHGWWGYYAMSPDHNAIVGAATDPEGFLYATGFSGHGFQQGPVVGQYLAEVALGLDPLLDLGPLSLERFRGHRPRPEVNVV
jgi:sarcosine oxidase subunit beta